jgi:putative SOS response-associated peptidase YedK
VLHFTPKPAKPMLVPCLYSKWGTGTDEFYSFAAITDEPPAEAAAAGHDRCIVNLKEKNVDARLSVEGRTTAELQTILATSRSPTMSTRRWPPDGAHSMGVTTKVLALLSAIG